MAAIDIAFAQLKVDEGLRLKPYTDQKGNITIGYGRNLTADGISENIADEMLSIDVQVAEQICQEAVSNFNILSNARQAALIGMAFNLGRAGFGEFTQFLGYIEANNFPAAANDLLQTEAAKELPARYGRYAEAILNG